MRAFLLALLLTPNQTPTPTALPSPTNTRTALTQSLLGRWTGVLEYRDYSEPAASTKRVQLPTWLTIQPAPEGLFTDYIYDDGPSKTLTDHSTLVLNLTERTYKVIAADGPGTTYTITGLDQLKDGHGTLTLTGAGTDNNKPAEIRTTLTIRRNLLSWLEEVRPAASTDPFTFRHRYTFTRADPPTPTIPSAK